MTFILIEATGQVMRIHGPTWPGVLRSLVGNGGEALPVHVPDGEHVAWAGERAREQGQPVNVVATLLLAQWDRPAAAALYGPVAVCGPMSGSASPGDPGAPQGIAKALAPDDVEYIAGLAEDIACATRGAAVSVHVADRAWPDAIRLAAAVLRDLPPDVQAEDDAAVAYLMRHLGAGDRG